MIPSIKTSKKPLMLLSFTLIVSEILMGSWMLVISTEPYERVIAGSLFVAILIAFLVVFCVMYHLKTEFDKWFCTPFPNPKEDNALESD